MATHRIVARTTFLITCPYTCLRPPLKPLLAIRCAKLDESVLVDEVSPKCFVGNHSAAHFELVGERTDTVRQQLKIAILVECSQIQFTRRQQELSGNVIAEPFDFAVAVGSANSSLSQQQVHGFVQQRERPRRPGVPIVNHNKWGNTVRYRKTAENAGVNRAHVVAQIALEQYKYPSRFSTSSQQFKRRHRIGFGSIFFRIESQERLEGCKYRLRSVLYPVRANEWQWFGLVFILKYGANHSLPRSNFPNQRIQQRLIRSRRSLDKVRKSTPRLPRMGGLDK